jgi:hypothetical protein
MKSASQKRVMSRSATRAAFRNCRKNFSLGSFDAPQRAHLAANGAPHSAQNRRPSRLSVPHFAQTIRLSLRVRRVQWRVLAGRKGEDDLERGGDAIAIPFLAGR